jgi:hypothetical protein
MNYDLNKFKSLKEKFEKTLTIASLFSVRTATQNHTFEAGYETSLLITKPGKKSYYRGGFNQATNIKFSQNSSRER